MRSRAGPSPPPRPGHARWVVPALLVAAALLYLVPLVWMFSTSIKPESQATSGSMRLLPDPAGSVLSQARDNYAAVWNDSTVHFPLYLRNTLVIAILSVAGMTLSSAVAAYGFSRVEWKGRGAVFAFMLATMMIPFPVLMGPLFVLFGKLGWIGTMKPLWVPAFFGNAFNIFLLRQFYMGIPRELDEAARIDGCGHWGIFTRVILPLSKPALGVVALFHFTYVWTDFLGPLIFLVDRDQFTLGLALHMYQSKAGNTPWNLLMAASAMVAAPLLLLFLLVQRSFVRGVAAEGLKG